MLGRGRQIELENRCLELVRTGEVQRRELGAACRRVKEQLGWVEAVFAAAKAGGPVLVGAAGLAGLWLGRGRKGGLLPWVSRVRTGVQVLGIIRRLFRKEA